MRFGPALSHALVLQGGFAKGTCKHRLTPEKLEAAISIQGLQDNLFHLDRIAREHGGNRAYGTSGYKASSDYLVEQISSPEFRVWTQPFNHTYAETRDISLAGPDGEAVEVYSLLYNHPTPVPDGVAAELVALPVDDSRGERVIITQARQDRFLTASRLRVLC
jgi:aminopeptidase Y